jgi:pSer/pThr/pTyr-binding forkhead associated (FHA) protein
MTPDTLFLKRTPGPRAFRGSSTIRRAGVDADLSTERLTFTNAAAAVDAAPSEPAELPGPGHYLSVDSGSEPHVLRLSREITHIGRGLTADLRLDDHLVSRRHAVVMDLAVGTRIVDDRSANGVIVNGTPVTEAILRDGDVIVLGRTVLRYLCA